MFVFVAAKRLRLTKNMYKLGIEKVSENTALASVVMNIVSARIIHNISMAMHQIDAAQIGKHRKGAFDNEMLISVRTAANPTLMMYITSYRSENLALLIIEKLINLPI